MNKYEISLIRLTNIILQDSCVGLSYKVAENIARGLLERGLINREKV